MKKTNCYIFQLKELIFIGLCLTLFSFLFPQSSLAADTSLLQYPGVVKVDPNTNVAENNQIIPGDYAYLMRYYPGKTKLEYFGETTVAAGQVRISVATANQPGEHYVMYRNVSIFNGRFIDLKISVIEFTGNNTDRLRFHMALDDEDEFLRIDIQGAANRARAKLKYEFFYNDTGEVAAGFKTMWNYKRLNKNKSVSIPVSPSYLHSIFTYSNSELVYTSNPKDPSDTIQVVGVSGGESETQEMTTLYNTVDASFINSLNNGAIGLGYLKYESSPIVQVELPYPQIAGDVREDFPKISYQIYQDIPEQAKPNFYPKNYRMQVTFDDKAIDMKKFTWKVKNISGTDVTNKFTFNVVGNQMVITVPDALMANPDFVDNTYIFSLESELRQGADVDLNSYYQSDGYIHVPASVKYDTRDYSSSANSGIAKTKLKGEPTGTPIPQIVMVGSSSADLTPAKLVKDLKGILLGEEVEIVGFKAPKQFNTVGSDNIIVVLKGKKTGLVGEVTVPITVKQYSMPLLVTTIQTSIKQNDNSWVMGNLAKPGDLVQVKVQTSLTNDFSYWENAVIQSTLSSKFSQVTPISARLLLPDGTEKSLKTPTVSAAAPYVIRTVDEKLKVNLKGSILELVYYAKIADNAGTTTEKISAQPEGLQPGGTPIKATTIEETISVVGTTTVTVKFIDKNNKDLVSPLSLEKEVGSIVDFSKDPDVQETLSKLSEKKYVITKRPENEKNTVIKDKDNIISYVLEGMLSIVSAPSEIDFGTQKVGYSDIEADRPIFDKDLIIWDNRTDLPKWTLKARLSQVLTNQADSNKKLPNAIKYKTGTSTGTVTLSDSETAIPLLTTQNSDAGEYNVSDSWRKGESGFQINLPAGSVRKLGEYQAEIVWTVSETP